MSHRLTVFHVKGGKLEAVRPAPDSLKRVAEDANNGIRAGGRSPTQARIEEMISCCLDIIRRATNGDESIPRMHFEDASEVEKLTDYVCRQDENGFYYASLLPEGRTLAPSQLIAAYALHKTDLAAQCLLDGNPLNAVEELALACQASADYAFHFGFHDYSQMQREDGSANARNAVRNQATIPTRAYVLSRWKEANHTKTWKKLSFAKRIKDDVIKLAKDHGWTMSDDNALRWIVGEITKDVNRGQSK